MPLTSLAVGSAGTEGEAALALLEGNKRHPKMLPMLLGRSQAARSVVIMDNLLADPDATVRRPPSWCSPSDRAMHCAL